MENTFRTLLAVEVARVQFEEAEMEEKRLGAGSKYAGMVETEKAKAMDRLQAAQSAFVDAFDHEFGGSVPLPAPCASLPGHDAEFRRRVKALSATYRIH